MTFKIKFILLIFSLLLYSATMVQDNHTLSGTVSSVIDNETLIGVNIQIKELGTSVSTNEYGFY